MFGALELKGYEIGVSKVIEEVLKDMEYYRQTGGGLTLSGGEPLLQADFTTELLKSAKSKGIHTCVETSGWAEWEKIEDIIPFTDLFLYDYKASDASLHRELIGVDNEPINNNLNRLLSGGVPVILRCPLVPGINDSDRHLAVIARIGCEYPGIAGIELMAYHNLGAAKEERLGRAPSMSKLPNTSDEIKAQWLRKLSEFGCSIARIG